MKTNKQNKRFEKMISNVSRNELLGIYSYIHNGNVDVSDRPTYRAVCMELARRGILVVHPPVLSGGVEIAGRPVFFDKPETPCFPVDDSRGLPTPSNITGGSFLDDLNRISAALDVSELALRLRYRKLTKHVQTTNGSTS